jgi:methionine biosynthesis protein MetW
METVSNPEKLEYKIIARLIEAGSSVLDLGCGDGELLSLLKKEGKVIRSQGIEIDEKAIYKCVARGLSVFHGDIDSGLAEYEDNSFDYVILNQSFQQVKKPDVVVGEALRVGKQAIIGFPNFAYFKARYHLALKGRAPLTRSLPYEWYDTPNIHFLSIADFINYCHNRNIIIKKAFYLRNNTQVKVFPNLLALLGIFLVGRSNQPVNLEKSG